MSRAKILELFKDHLIGDFQNYNYGLFKKGDVYSYIEITDDTITCNAGIDRLLTKICSYEYVEFIRSIDKCNVAKFKLTEQDVIVPAIVYQKSNNFYNLTYHHGNIAISVENLSIDLSPYRNNIYQLEGQESYLYEPELCKVINMLRLITHKDGSQNVVYNNGLFEIKFLTFLTKDQYELITKNKNYKLLKYQQ